MQTPQSQPRPGSGEQAIAERGQPPGNTPALFTVNVLPFSDAAMRDSTSARSAVLGAPGAIRRLAWAARPAKTAA